jgi:FkbM family methyltransferase
MIIDLQSILISENITPLGVIHIGAHKGQELQIYEKCGFIKVIFIEANPEIFHHLENLKSEICDVSSHNIAISDKEDIIDFYITTDNNGNGEMSSSILKLKKHKELYPNIVHKKTISVKTISLDEFLLQNNFNPIDYNMLNMDIQGAELLALKGGVKLLPNIDIINTEINKSELYENCALNYEIDEFLRKFGFVKYKEDYAYSTEWGDAIFLKK